MLWDIPGWLYLDQPRCLQCSDVCSVRKAGEIHPSFHHSTVWCQYKHRTYRISGRMRESAKLCNDIFLCCGVGSCRCRLEYNNLQYVIPNHFNARTHTHTHTHTMPHMCGPLRKHTCVAMPSINLGLNYCMRLHSLFSASHLKLIAFSTACIQGLKLGVSCVQLVSCSWQLVSCKCCRIICLFRTENT